ncbi:hypothetical protein [Streptomyces sp. NPDC051677]|uniref:hypothetical protein n=1 Tax=Streptomyces sp. NPDC051677 TaxID=3365669 RepID=UPI0037D09B4C
MTSRALVIGVGEYDDDADIIGYPTIEASAHAYGAALAQDPRWGAAARSSVLEPHEVRTADGVMRALEEAAAAGEGPEDTLLVVYVGHGAFWTDVPGGQVHLAVGSSRSNKPWTWLSAWYVYRAIRQSKAGLKVLIADCCYSNVLPSLGPDSALPGALGTPFRGTCVLTAVGGEVTDAWASSCDNLPPPLNACTPFSGHLLNVLEYGMPDHPDDLTLGALRAGIVEGMRRCGAGVHRTPRMLLNDASEVAPLFTNRMKGEQTGASDPGTADEWVRDLLLNGVRDLSRLMSRPDIAGRVVAELRRGDELSRDLAGQVDRQAVGKLSGPGDFVKYWVEAEPVKRRAVTDDQRAE